jgi:hypothetical protein
MVRTARNPFSRNLHSIEGIILLFVPRNLIRLEPKYRPTTNEIFALIFSPIMVKRNPYNGPNSRPDATDRREAGKKINERKE